MPDHASHHRVRKWIRHRLVCSISATLFASQLGCVALNIPSERHFDPRDGGGLFGEWKKPGYPGRVLQRLLSDSPAGLPETHLSEMSVGSGAEFCAADDAAFVVDGGVSQPVTHCFGDDMSSSMMDSANAGAPVQEPEVPWPRYHSVPTRPVFGGPRQVW